MEKLKVVKPPKPEKPPKIKKERPPPKVKEVKEVAKQDDSMQSEDDDEEQQSSPGRKNRARNESTRTSGRVRGRLVNYNEDRDEEEFIMRTERRIIPKHLQTSALETSPLQVVVPPSMQSPPPIDDQPIDSPNVSQNPSEAATSNQSAINHPPIVLRISKVSKQMFEILNITYKQRPIQIQSLLPLLLYTWFLRFSIFYLFVCVE